MMRYGIGRVRLARKHPESASLSQWAPAALLGMLAVGVLAALIAVLAGSWIPAVLAVPAILFVLLTIAASIDLGRRHGIRHTLFGPLAYGAIYAGLGAGMWVELFRASPKTQARSAHAAEADLSQELRK
jgi:hypothetical protein